MNQASYQQTDVSILRRGRMRRRDFLRTIPAGALAAGAVGWTDWVGAHSREMRRKNKACILLWMQGGPSQFETLDPKPSHDNGGGTEVIDTAVSGVKIAANLPKTAEVLDDVCVFRSLNSPEGSHPRGTYLMHTGYIPTAAVQFPTLGSNVTAQLDSGENDLPGFIRIGQNRLSPGGGFLGVDYEPFEVTNPNRVPDNTTLATNERRYKRRLGLLNQLDGQYAERGAEQQVEEHQKLYNKTSRMILSPQMNVFDLEREPARVREAYGNSQFGASCLLARRLIDTGVTFVEVTSNGWDTHFDNMQRTTELCGQIDQPYAALLNDLKQRGMLDSTLVIWMGEFGRTPRVNGRGGRDHYPRAFNASLAGAGVRGGQVIGKTDRGGNEIADRPVSHLDFFRTIFHALDIDPDYENEAVGRPIRLVDGGEVVEETFTG